MADNTILYGTWQFNEVIDMSNVPATEINFRGVVNEVVYDWTYIYSDGSSLCYRRYEGQYWYNYAYYKSWSNDGYKKIAISSNSTSANFMTWLQSNATKISDTLLDLRKPKTIYNELMGELTDVINEKSGSSGVKNLKQLVDTAKNINNTIPEGYIQPSGTLDITTNGIFDIYEKASVNVNVPTDGGNGGSSVEDNTSLIFEGGCFNEYSNPQIKELKRTIFNGTQLKKINLPNCTYLCNNAFADCVSLSEINIPKVKHIGDNAFKNIKFSSFNFLDCEYIGNSAFYSNNKITEINLPECSYVGNGEFSNCYNLVSCSLPKCVTIGSGAFMGPEFTELNLPECRSIYSVAFASMISLRKVSLPKCEFLDYNAFSTCHSLESITASNVTKIGTGVFLFNSSLSYVDLPNLTMINAETFRYCRAMTDIFVSKCHHIGRQAFEGCTLINKGDWDLVVTTSDSAFASCTSLEFCDLTLANYIGRNFFSGCVNLKSVVIGNPSSIYNNAFYGCNKLKSINIPLALKEIPRSAFDGCTALERIYLEKGSPADKILSQSEYYAQMLCYIPRF
jgi:hypothetical protein